MLPEAKNYLHEGGYSKKPASWLLIGLFLFGALGIRVLSRFLHHFIPSHVVDCDHTHDDEEMAIEEMEEHHHDHEHTEEHNEVTPLLSDAPSKLQQTTSQPEMSETHENGFGVAPLNRRPTFMPRTLTRTFSALAASQKTACDETGPCMGYSDPCGAECFRAVSRRQSAVPGLLRQPTFSRGRSSTLRVTIPEVQEEASTEQSRANSSASSEQNGVRRTSSRGSFAQPSPMTRSRSATHHYHHPPHENGNGHGHAHSHTSKRRPSSNMSSGSHAQAHHHHVPTNAFMSIGLQTSIAIALHKLPEGFITYATNHANPTLGFSVFMALFIHNLTEGFAMALPLYLALNSRLKAIIWSTLLGGASQPLGAGIAALWFKAAGEGSMKPGDRVYGGMFAVTAGIMTSVALSLFSESLAMTHSKGLCNTFAFLGMGVLGISFALTGH